MGSDRETPASGLSYNLRVGTSNNPNAVVSALSSSNGFREVVAVVNAGQRTSQFLRHLPPGHYLWSVQSIDHAFAGSAFSEQGSFVIPNAPPVQDHFITLPEDSAVEIVLGPRRDESNNFLNYSILLPPAAGLLETNFPSVTYRPSTNYFGADRFTFQVANELASVRGTVTLNILPVVDQAFTQMVAGRRADGSLEFFLVGEPYQFFDIEVSENLFAWRFLQRVQADAQGRVSFQAIDLSPYRFFRAVRR